MRLQPDARQAHLWPEFCRAKIFFCESQRTRATKYVERQGNRRQTGKEQSRTKLAAPREKS